VVTVLSGPESGIVNFVGNLQVHGWNPANAVRTTFETVDGTLRYHYPNGLFYALLPAHPMYLTPLVAPLLAIGAWRLVRLRSAAVGWLVLGWGLAVYAFHAGDPYQNLRFGLAYLPPVALVAATGAVHVLEWGTARNRGITTVFAVAGLLALAASGVGGIRRLADRKHADVATAAWAAVRMPPGARVIVFELTLTLQHEAAVETHELFFVTPDSARTLLQSPRPLFLLVDVDDLRRQWRNRIPFETYRRLEAEPGLTPLGRHRSYTLFRVGPA